MDAITELNGVKYKYEYKLSNVYGELSLNDSAIEILNIEDNLFDPFAFGDIVIYNPNNFLESSFTYRGDGTDKISIRLEPEQDSSKKLEYEFIITEEINYVDRETPVKNKKIYRFIDSDESLLKSKFPYNTHCSGKGGVILKDILKFLKLPVDEQKFEDCDFTIGDIPSYITPSLNFRYLDLIYYILKYLYISSGKIATKPFLKKYGGKYQLVNLEKLFEDNKKEAYEAFHSGDLVTEFTTNSNNPPPDDVPYKPNQNNLKSYNISTPDKAISNTFLMNSLVVTNDPFLGVSRINEVRLNTIVSEWQKKFVDKFSSVGGQTVKFISLTKDKKEGEFKTYRLPFNSIHNTNIVIADLINNLIFFNLQLQINISGDTGRRSGVFIDVFKAKGDDTPADAKLLGRWLVTRVKHSKYKNTLTNEIAGVKTYAGPSYKEKDG
jgi:hypothetical protein